MSIEPYEYKIQASVKAICNEYNKVIEERNEALKKAANLDLAIKCLNEAIEQINNVKTCQDVGQIKYNKIAFETLKGMVLNILKENKAAIG